MQETASNSVETPKHNLDNISIPYLDKFIAYLEDHKEGDSFEFDKDGITDLVAKLMTIRMEAAYWKQEALGECSESKDIVREFFAVNQVLAKAKILTMELSVEVTALAWDLMSGAIKNPTEGKGRLKRDVIPKIDELANILNKEGEILRIGDIVKPKEGQLRSGACTYPNAVIISLDPFVMVDQTLDMRWGTTYKEEDVIKIGEADADTLHGCFTRIRE